MNIETISLLTSAIILLAVRHSLDLDHVVAITDITAAERNKRRALMSSFGYVSGHGAVTFVLGGIAYTIGISLPDEFEAVMEKIVGGTLVILAAAVLYSTIRYRDGTKIMSGWRFFSLLSTKIFRLSEKAGTHKNGAHKHKPDGKVGFLSSVIIGAIHGIGVESPTQMAFLGSAATLQSPSIGFVAILLFVFTVMVANMSLAILLVTGFQSAKHKNSLFLFLSVASAAFGAYVGIKMLFS
ncbi:MAG: hypothetical protein IAF58_05565 [Leptolyngbya sp.]|nr:hypothetical protein [Candidatus Melainabacteria bacterium]